MSILFILLSLIYLLKYAIFNLLFFIILVNLYTK